MSDTARVLEALCKAYLTPTAGGAVTFATEVLPLVSTCHWLTATVADETTLRFAAGDGAVFEFTLPNARTTLRTVCARLSAFASENGGGAFSPYGGEHVVSITPGGRPLKVRIHFDNRLGQGRVWFHLERVD